MAEKKLVLYNPYGIGNTILMLPMLQSLKNSSFNYKIFMVVTQNVVKDLLSDQNLLDEIYLYESKANNKNSYQGLLGIIHYVTNNIKLILLTRKLNATYLVILAKVGYKEYLYGILSGAKTVLGYKKVAFINKMLKELKEFDEIAHETDAWLDLVGQLTENTTTSKTPNLQIKKNLKLLKGNKRIGIHPGCSEALKFKRWPVESYIDLIRMVKKNYDVDVLILGGKGELFLGQKIEKSLAGLVDNYVGVLDIKSTANLIQDCDLFISNDSGLMHLASALNVRQIALFGTSNTEKFRPRSPNAIVIDGKKLDKVSLNPIDNISVSLVYETVAQCLA
ncbi:glycosyltransferase family 9 protein [Polynucleobacter sp. CS-Odin-A6]|uniref:glycosyltransferase family 9 protein n=1 Tax=Polynucleobacter sp. CS-Odin-A6 TaxID=2689106 RepID=UPI001C0DDC99|nr:glycosyltransferase family 9 protein [Polynucleobacter sp. CS-Odin-A6]MBU3621117.1 glycosyltransferase family 9 protein [Polynucleobacter sp. CS-Odin-A6]